MSGFMSFSDGVQNIIAQVQCNKNIIIYNQFNSDNEKTVLKAYDI
jgi:hypothetical protein